MGLHPSPVECSCINTQAGHTQRSSAGHAARARSLVAPACLASACLLILAARAVAQHACCTHASARWLAPWPFALAHSPICAQHSTQGSVLPCARVPSPLLVASYCMGDELPCSSSHARTIQHPLRVTRSVCCFVRASFMSELHKN